MLPSELLTLLPPPKDNPHGAGERDWTPVEEQFGTQFPDDFKEFIRVYGAGHICNSEYGCGWSIFNPFSQDPVDSMYYGYEECWDAQEALQVAVFPDPDGILPWAIDAYGNYFAWVTRGRPNEWVIRSCALHLPEKSEVFNMSFSAFLVAFLTGEVVPPIVNGAGKTPFWYAAELPSEDSFSTPDE